ncbi:MAG TPA: 2-isopropylmalate synthase [Christensenellaceae bacterium]|nr:2-isopropylmalate synthase [Christensenellaceae bacterium]
MRTIKIFDTTLRDGEQAPGCSMDLKEKLELALALEKMGVDILEAGFAIASPGDFESVSEIAKVIKNAIVVSLARATMKDIDVAYDAVKHAVSPRIHTFLATSPTHMEYKLRMSEQQVLDTILQMVKYAKGKLNDVEFSCEDATRSDRNFLVKAVQAAVDAGATTINIPDTVGYTTPSEMSDLISYLLENVNGLDAVDLSVHCHNDLGLAAANTLAAINAGATQIETTMCGLGERAGNAAMEEVVMALHTRKDIFPVKTNIDTTRIYPVSRLVYSIIGMQTPLNKPIVGTNAFAHEAGIHQHGVLANASTYEIMTPESVGLTTNKMILGKHSGRHAVEDRLKDLGYTLTKEEMDELFTRFKALSDRKKTINDSDLEALVLHRIATNGAPWKLDRFTVNSGNYVACSAVVRLSHEGQLYEEVALGDGPIDAAYNAIDKIMNVPEHKLEDYTIQTISEGKDAQGEAIVKLGCCNRSYTGRGLSTDVMEASILAYINGMNKLL